MIGDLKIAIAQVNPIVGDIGYNIALVKGALKKSREADLVVFPELVVSGYPPEDLILMPSFVQDCQSAARALVKECAEFPAFILTTPWAENGRVYNAALLADKGKITHTVFKYALPDYGVFDEARVFSQGPLPEAAEFRGTKLGIMICEDMWHPHGALHLKESGAEILIVPNGSPYDMMKHPDRVNYAYERVKQTGLPLLYVNQVGGQDDLVFDGGSFGMDSAGDIIFEAPLFESYTGPVTSLPADPAERGPDTIYGALKLGLKDYVAKNDFPGVIIGMSGGIDSALSAAIAVDALGEDKVRCVMLPSPFTSKESFDDAEECCKALGCSYEIISIENAMKVFEATIPNLSGVAHENMQSRARGLILMSLSNQSGAMVLTTGNKSEIAVGYSTLYGDMCGGFNVLKDVYKSLVYNLAKWRNEQSPVIPERIITKAPTAELREGQTDQDSLPPYDILDNILNALIEGRYSANELSAQGGYDPDTVRKVKRLLDLAEYKRRQSAPGPKITPLAFGRDRRYPITNGYRNPVEKS